MTTPLTQTTGRRKRAVARVRFRNGSGTVTVNNTSQSNPSIYNKWVKVARPWIFRNI